MAVFEVVEMFTSINGEGTRAGQLALFIRMKGCNLHCSFCDTAWANETDSPFIRMTTEQVLEKIGESGIENITLTGGEPLLQPGIRDLTEAIICTEKHRVEIETNGSVPLSAFRDHGERISVTMDYKLPGSGMEPSMCTDNFRFLKPNDTVKFVVSDTADLDRAKAVTDEFRLTERCHVYLSPVFGRIDPSKIVEYMKKHRMNDVNLQLQMHKIIWDPQQRGV